MGEDPYAAFRREWDALAESYDRYVAPVLAPFGERLVDLLGLVGAPQVLDIATRTGQTALEMAARLPDARVVGVDPSLGVLAVAGRRAATMGLLNVAFLQMDPAALDFPDGFFHAAVSNIGLTGLPDPAAAAREAARVLRPGGAFAMSAWGHGHRVPFLRVIDRAAQPLLPGNVPPPDGGPFRFSRPGALDTFLRDAGFSDVRVETYAATVTYHDPDDYWRARMDGTHAGFYIRRLPENQVASIRDRVRQLLQGYRSEGRIILANQVLLALAVK